MSKDTVTVKTIEELVEYTIKRRDDNKWELRDRSAMVYNDPEAGAAWAKEEDEASSRFYAARKEERAVSRLSWYDAPERLELDARRPEMHSETEFTLYVCTGSHHSRWWRRTIELSPEMGKMIDDIWTKKMKYGYPTRVGNLTLAGMLKRLGRGDVAVKIDAEKNRIEAEYQKTRRNNFRKSIIDKAKEFVNLLNQAEAAGIDAAELKLALLTVDVRLSPFEE